MDYMIEILTATGQEFQHVDTFAEALEIIEECKLRGYEAYLTQPGFYAEDCQ